MDKKRGIICQLYNGKIGEVLLYFSREFEAFYIPWCMKIDAPGMILAKSYQNLRPSVPELREIAEQCIWELILHMYPVGAKMEQIDNYQDFEKSECACCLIYYDCGELEIYIKDSERREKVWDLLQSLQASNLEYITDASDGRTGFYV